MSMEFCYYCGEPQREKIGCCGENHFGELYGFKCEDLSKEYPYGVEWSFDSDGRDIIDVQWFKTEDERDIFTEEEGFNMIREEKQKEWTAEKFEPAVEEHFEKDVYYCVYCFAEQNDRLSCCQENHFLSGKDLMDREKELDEIDKQMKFMHEGAL